MEDHDVSVVAVYVPAPLKRNLDIGLHRSVWGWKPDTARKADTPQVLAALKPGDYILLGHRGPNARVGVGGWSDAVLRQVAIARVTGPVELDATSEVWPDDVYPVRVPLEILGVIEHVAGEQLGSRVMEALRLSANKQGAPVPVPAPGATVMDWFLDHVGSPSKPEEALEEAASGGLDPADPAERSLGLGPHLDRPTLTFARHERANLRHMLFPAHTASCDLCGRTLPTRFLRAQHIRKRAQSNLTQRRDRANVLAACVLGCDALFEDGLILVTPEGRVEISPKAKTTHDLLAAAQALEGRLCTAHNAESEEYFAWHRHNVVAPPPRAGNPAAGEEVPSV
ncbi:hypothetical protein ACH4E7_43800 [Kitasatospora sp. NPDC018058]|uniref:hypothetical protein n=1 Tax=Kitasatospora sp. NPDC018058 TaxID=3364025 RepID=UPI0037C0EA9A